MQEDQAYLVPVSVHLQILYQQPQNNEEMKIDNKVMKEVRVAVEWLFSNAENCFRFNHFKKDMKLFLSPAEKSTVFVLYCRIHILSFMEIK